MLTHIDKKTNTKYTLILEPNWFDSVLKSDLKFSNDIYKKYDSMLNMTDAELIVCDDFTNCPKEFCKKVVLESYEEYLKLMSEHNFKKEQWIYNIIDGIAEQDDILYRDEFIVIIPCYTWSKNSDKNLLHLLTIPTDKTIRTIRDLDAQHIMLLEHIKETTHRIIKSIYAYDPDMIKMYIHYLPSTYQFHVHSALVINNQINSSCEYSHELDTIITNIKIKTDYYQSIIMKKRI